MKLECIRRRLSFKKIVPFVWVVIALAIICNSIYAYEKLPTSAQNLLISEKTNYDVLMSTSPDQSLYPTDVTSYIDPAEQEEITDEIPTDLLIPGTEEFGEFSWSNANSGQASDFEYTYIWAPEPVTSLFLVLGGLCVIRKRRDCR